MRAPVFWRKLHYWLSAIAALPLLLVIATGLLLQVKKDIHWIQPSEQSGTGKTPQISFDEILAICATQPQAGVRGWDDIHRVDLRPDAALLKVATHSGWELQIDAANGRLLQFARRRSDLIESLHDGSWFGDAAKRLIFLPAGLSLLILWGTGIYLFLIPRVRTASAKPPNGSNR